MYADRTNLTDRQREVLLAAAEGLTDKGIARRLGIRPQTVKNHKTNIFIQIGALNITDAVARGFRRGLIE